MNRKGLNRHFRGALAFLLMIALVLPGVGYATESDLVEFDSALMHIFTGEIDSARSFTQSSDLRAMLAVLLQYEFYHQLPDYETDVTEPIYLAITDSDLITLAFCGDGEYVTVFYRSDPFITAYGFLPTTDSAEVKSVLESSNESVWTISLLDFLEQLQALADLVSD